MGASNHCVYYACNLADQEKGGREKDRRGRLDEGKIALLERIPHWRWETDGRAPIRQNPMTCADALAIIGTRPAEHPDSTVPAAVAPARPTPTAWLESHRRVHEFVGAHGRFPVRNSTTEQSALAGWVRFPRKKYRGAVPSPLTQAQIDAMENIHGWKWSATSAVCPESGDDVWLESFDSWEGKPVTEKPQIRPDRPLNTTE